MDRRETLADMIGTLMRVMLVSERTPADYQHAVRYNPLDFHTLGALRVSPGMRASDLATYLGVAPTTTSSVIARLIKRGLIEKTKSKEDGRAVALDLTEDGRALALTIRAQDIHNMELFLSSLEAEEQAEIIRLLGKVVTRVAELDAG